MWIPSSATLLRTRRGSVLDPSDLLVDNLDVVERAIRFAARRHRFDPSDAQDFEGVVKLKLVENDYAILRAFEGRSSFRTFISTVVQRLALDYAIHLWGKWHPSAEAKRLGPLVVALEEQLYRNGRTLEEAVTHLQGKHEGVSHASLQALAAKLPKHEPRPYVITLPEDHPIAQPSDADEPLLADERRRAAQELSRLISPIMARLSKMDRLILQLKFGGMSVAQIARSFALDQKLTYRRIEGNLKELRRELERAGVRWDDVADLIGRDEVFVHFDIGNQNPRPSMPDDESTGPDPDTEEP